MSERWTNGIHQGDVTETLSEMPESSVHCVMTSPPYFGLRDYGADGQIGLEDSLEEYIDELLDVASELRRVLREDGSWWLNLGDSFADKSKMLVPHRVAIALQDSGWTVRADCPWVKPNPMPHPVKDRLHEHKEFVFHLTPEPDYWFDLDAVREPHKESSLQRRGRYDYNTSGTAADAYPDGQGRDDEYIGTEPEDALHPNGKNPGDVFEISVKPFPEAHFAVYPPELCEAPIKSSCPDQVCAECGTPYERIVKVTRPWEVEDPDRDQLRRAQELAEQAGLTPDHYEAIQSVGINDEEYGQLTIGGGDNTPETVKLAAEAKDTLGAYFREFLTNQYEPTEKFEQACDCDTDETEAGIVLDPFAGAGTTCMVAKDLGRRFIGIDLNPDYVAMAQKRVGVTVDEPERLLEDDDQTTLAQTDGGRTEADR